MAGLGAPAEIASLRRDALRLAELKDFLAQSANPSNLKRIAELDDELARIEKRLAELDRTPK
jgi:hypothetical protein